MFDVAIVGAGVIGGMIARELSKYQLSVCLLEKENDVACGASKANSGIIHGGYDPEPDTLKAKLNVIGVEKLFEAANELNVPIKRNGSLVCAFSSDEDKTVKELYERGIKNGVNGLIILSGDEAREAEPNLSENITSTLLVTNAGIVCPYELTIAAVGNAMDNGAVLYINYEVTSIVKEDNNFNISSSDGRQITAKYLINCAGCYADKIAELLDDKFFEIIPRAGEYMLLDKTEGKTVSHTIFQIPTKEGKGILVTPTVDGNLLTGPTALEVDTPENNETTLSGLDFVSELAKKSVPNVNFRNVITSFSGVRSSEKNGDFIIKASEKVENLIHVAAIDSPGLTSCVAIAEYAVDILKNIGAELHENPEFNGKRENPHFFRTMSDEEKNEYIKIHPEYGRIVCRCETVSEGEIRDAIRRNPPAHDIDGIKRRTRSGMGRCQSGFCSPFVTELLAEENNISMETVTKKGKRSFMLKGKL